MCDILMRDDYNPIRRHADTQTCSTQPDVCYKKLGRLVRHQFVLHDHKKTNIC